MFIQTTLGENRCRVGLKNVGNSTFHPVHDVQTLVLLYTQL